MSVARQLFRQASVVFRDRGSLGIEVLAWTHPTALDDRWFAIIDWMLPFDNRLPGALATLSFGALGGGHPLAQLV